MSWRRLREARRTVPMEREDDGSRRQRDYSEIGRHEGGTAVPAGEFVHHDMYPTWNTIQYMYPSVVVGTDGDPMRLESGVLPFISYFCPFWSQPRVAPKNLARSTSEAMI